MHLFQENLLGIAYLVGDVPFSHGSNIDHVWSLEKEDTILSKACKNPESFMSKQLQGAWMLHSGEQAHWPDVEAACAKLEPSDPDTNKDARYTHTRHAHCTHIAHTHATRTHKHERTHSKHSIHNPTLIANVVKEALNTIFTKYPVWKTQLRKSCLHVHLHPAVVKYFQRVIADEKVEELGQDIPAENSTLSALVEDISKAMALYDDPETKACMEMLREFRVKSRGSQRSQAFRDIISRYMPVLFTEDPPSECTIKLRSTLCTGLLSFLQSSSGPLLLWDTEITHQVVQVFDAVTKFAVQEWSDQLVENTAHAMMHGLEFDPDITHSEDKPRIEAARNRVGLLTFFKKLKDVVGKYTDLSPDAECRVSNPEAPDLIMTIVEKLMLLQDYAERVSPSGESPFGEAIQKLTAEADQHINSMKNYVKNKHGAPLLEEQKKLRDIAGGKSNGRIWHEDIAQDAMLEDLIDASTDNLLALDANLLTTTMRSMIQARCHICTHTHTRTPTHICTHTHTRN